MSTLTPERLEYYRSIAIQYGPDFIELLEALDEAQRIYEVFPEGRMHSTFTSKFNALLDRFESFAADLSEKSREVERLNQMLRDTGYGQGQIDAYAAQCEEVERLAETCRRWERLFMDSVGPAPPMYVDHWGAGRWVIMRVDNTGTCWEPSEEHYNSPLDALAAIEAREAKGGSAS